MSRTTITIDGREHPPSDGEWVFWSPDGEPVGCMHVSRRTWDDPGKAAREFWDTATEAMNRLARGYRVELMTRERWAAEVMPRMRLRSEQAAEGGGQ